MAALRDLLSPPVAVDAPAIELRSVGAVQAAAITATVDAQDIETWFQGALGELFATVAGQELRETGHADGVYADELFTLHRGQATVFVPCDGPVRPVGRVTPLLVPEVELAEVDRAYGTLAAYVARHALAVAGPIREYYLVGRRHTPYSALWRTEVCLPVFRTAVGAPQTAC